MRWCPFNNIGWIFLHPFVQVGCERDFRGPNEPVSILRLEARLYVNNWTR